MARYIFFEGQGFEETEARYQIVNSFIYEDTTEEAPPSGDTIINQLQGPNLGADLFNGTIL